MTLGGTAQVAAAHCPNELTSDPTVCSYNRPNYAPEHSEQGQTFGHKANTSLEFIRRKVSRLYSQCDSQQDRENRLSIQWLSVAHSAVILAVILIMCNRTSLIRIRITCAYKSKVKFCRQRICHNKYEYTMDQELYT